LRGLGAALLMRAVKLRYSAALWLVLALATALCWPLTRVFWFVSHEHNEYVTRVVEYASAMQHGDLYPRWLPGLYGGYGSPFANFYAPGVYWLGGIFTLLFESPTLGLKLVVLLGTLLAAGATFALLFEDTRRADVAFLAACAYTTAPYRLAEVSWRGDLAELLALGMLPLALFAYRRIVHQTSSRAVATATCVAALAHAGLVMSHTLIGLWGTGIVAVVLAVSAYEQKRAGTLERTVPLGIAFASGLLISSLYTLPAMLEKKNVQTELMVLGGSAPENNPLALKALFDVGPHRTGPLLLAGAIVVGIAWWRRRRPSRAALAWLLGALALTLLTLRIAQPLWAAHVIPFGDYIQYPWRLLGPASLCASAALALGWAEAIPARRVSVLASVPVIAATVLSSLPHTELKPVLPEQLWLSHERVARSWLRGTAMDEYLPRVVVRPTLLPAAGVAQSSSSTQVRIESSAGTTHALTLDAASPGELELQLHAFPGWQVSTDRGPAEVELTTSERGLVSLHLPAPGHYTVTVSFGSTTVRTLAMTLSLLGLLGAWPLAWFATRRLMNRRARTVLAPFTMPEAV
jgi:hypothetical protein